MQKGTSLVISAEMATVFDVSTRIADVLRENGVSVTFLEAGLLPIKAVSRDRNCSEDHPSLDDICDSCHGICCMIVDVVEPENANLWSQFLRRLQHRARQNGESNRPVIIVVHRCPWPGDGAFDDVAITQLSFNDALSRADIVSLAHSLLPTRGISKVLRKVLVHTVASISLTDLDLLTHVASESLSEMTVPFDSLLTWARNQGFSRDSADLPRMYLEGEVLEHSVALALRGDRAGINRRIWAAQAGILLPWVEEERSKLVPELKAWLPKEHEGQIMQEFEVGTLDFLISRGSAPASLKNRTRLLRDIRNNLAHCGIISYSCLRAL